MADLTPGECRWDSAGLRCETHGCGFGDPCLKRGCPHCDARRATRYKTTVTEITKLQGSIERLEG